MEEEGEDESHERERKIERNIRVWGDEGKGVVC